MHTVYLYLPPAANEQQRRSGMSRLDREAARARCDAATEGPWHQAYDGRGGITSMDGWVGDTNTPQDGAFIRGARTDLPAALDLLDERDKADAVKDRLLARCEAALRRLAVVDCGQCFTMEIEDLLADLTPPSEVQP